VKECPALFCCVRLASPKGVEAGESSGLPGASAFPKQNGANADKLLTKRDDAPLKKARAINFGLTSLFFAFDKNPRHYFSHFTLYFYHLIFAI
jgi:hypothetical protein